MLSLINQFVYRPDATFAPSTFSPANLGLTFEEVTVQTADGLALSAWYLPAKRARHTLLYCHGNAGDIRDWVHAAPPFVEEGVSVLLWDYRGYGRSEGEPSEEGLYEDGVAIWGWLQGRSRDEGLPASVLGKSLGSAVAIRLAALGRPAKLILDSAFTSMREVLALNAPKALGGLLPPLFESLEGVPQISCPTLVVHGGQDTLVPISQGRRIYEALQAPKEMEVIEAAGHNGISAFPQYHRSILAFLDGPLGHFPGNGRALKKSFPGK